MCSAWLWIHSPQYSSRRSCTSSGSSVTPHASSIALHGADLIGDRADAAYPRGDVGRLGISAAAQECLEEPGRLVDVQLDALHDAVGQRDVQRAFAFDARQRPDCKRADLGGHRSFRSASEAGDVERREHPVDAVTGHSVTAQQRDQRRGVRRGGGPEAAVAAAVVRRAQRPASGVGHRAQAGNAVGDNHARHTRGACIRCTPSWPAASVFARPAVPTGCREAGPGRSGSPAVGSRRARAPMPEWMWPACRCIRGWA